MRIKRIPLSQSFKRLITINKKYNYQRVIIMENEKQQKRSKVYTKDGKKQGKNGGVINRNLGSIRL